jgi:hypothetical protein
MQRLDEADSEWSVKRSSERSFDDEFGSSVGSDAILLQIAILVVSIYTYAATSSCRDGFVGSRLSLTFGGVPSVSPLMVVHLTISTSFIDLNG